MAVVALASGTVLMVGDVPRWWGLLSDEQDNGLLRALDRGDKFASVLSLLVGIAALRVALSQRRQDGRGTGSTSRAVEQARQVFGFFVDRRGERLRLRWALRNPRSRLIVVHGPAGVGKTELVRRVLAKVKIDHRYHLVTPAFSPTVDTLVHALKMGGVDTGAELPLDSSPLGQLEAILRGRARKPSIIVLDSVERLLDDEHKLTDLALDEALDLIATAPRHGIKVVMISDMVPMAGAGGTWVNSACRIAVDGLPLDYFRTFVERSAGGRTGLLSSLDDRRLNEVRRDLGGRPRLAQLFDAVLESDQEATPLDLAGEVHGWAARVGVDGVGDRLRSRMTAAFRSDRRQVYRAVAAFATPVDVKMVTALANEFRPHDDHLETYFVRSELIELSRHAIHTDHQQQAFFLEPTEASRVLAWREKTDRESVLADRRLLISAAWRLRARRHADHHGDWANPLSFLAEVDAWLRADRADGAFKAIEDIEAKAADGNALMLFRRPRRLIAEQIEATERPANYNVLGYLHHASGHFGRAADYFRTASALAGDDKPGWRARILVNLAGLEWAQGSVGHAVTNFERALTMAPDDPVVRAGSLAGMARCRRRDGQHTLARRYLAQALRVAGSHPARRIPLELRLARLYIEIEQFREAESLLDGIRDETEEVSPLRAAYLDVQADLRLAQGDHDQARRLARDAVALALPAHDPVVALQARSTLSVVYMHEGRFNQAAREAAMARRYSGTDALIVLAIQGVAVRRAHGPSAARSVFAELVNQANLRTGLNDRDFAAWTLTGIARCAQALDTPTGSTKPALDDFTRARHPYTEPAPALTKLMTFLLKTIAADDEERARLKPAVDDLRSSLSHSTPGQGER
ncbi:ATP-binding protein [Micromonospora andamanensis]|uniref:ATP-binding protein n=1 Tax=Micromonospora andamanensis TaxID=1287068 RepID=UPI00194FD27B|nr:ATP-binding protein [Micromonospora andamanensis]